MDEGAASRNSNDVLVLRPQLKTLEEHVVITNKSVLKAEKERDNLQKELELNRSADAGEESTHS